MDINGIGEGVRTAGAPTPMIRVLETVVGGIVHHKGCSIVQNTKQVIPISTALFKVTGRLHKVGTIVII